MMDKYGEELDALVSRTVEMGLLALDLARDGEKVLMGGAVPENLGEKIDALDDMDAEVEASALRILILYQPMSTDMRVVASALKMVTYFERIGNYGAKLAEITHPGYGPCYQDIREMANLSVSMVVDAVMAFKTRDVSKVWDFRERDDKVDDLQARVSGNIANALPESVEESATMMNSLMGARYLERMGDHACKVAEKVIYAVEGRKVRID